MSGINILLIEDNSGDVYLVKEQLRDIENFNFDIVESQYLATAAEILQQRSFDAILLDLMLPDSQGLETFFAVNKLAPDTAIVIISALSEKELALQAVREGAQDYLAKGKIQPNTLSITIQYAMERKNISEQLKKRTAELEYLNQELEAFNYAVSHDLKNPLNFIKGMSSLLLTKKRSQPLEAQDKMCIERIQENSIRMEQMTKNLLSLSQVQRSPTTIEDVDLSELAVDAIETLKQQYPERKIEFTATPNILVSGDRQLLKLALENIIGNAWKYTQNNADAKIEFDTYKDESGIVYCVKDNGIGFNPQEAQQLFAPFQRLSNSKEYEGTGIGLATVKRIIDRHNGKIWFDAQPEQGASFMFTLNIDK